jgi:hypothetical protein
MSDDPFNDTTLATLPEDTTPLEQPLPGHIKKRRAHQRAEDVTVERIERFLECLADCGLVMHSADLAGLSWYTIKRLSKQDEDFKGLIDESIERYKDALVREAHRRAVEGWEEPVFSHKTGTQMGTIRKYDSRLLELMLKRHIPEFREKFEGEIKMTGGVLIAPLAPTSPASWAEKHGGEKLENYTDNAPQPQLPEPLEVEINSPPQPLPNP